MRQLVVLKELAEKNGVQLEDQNIIVTEAVDNITAKYNYSRDQIQDNFDKLLDETEQEAYRVYLEYEREYGESVFKLFTEYFIERDKIPVCHNR